jgi:hypothetical protein
MEKLICQSHLCFLKQFLQNLAWDTGRNYFAANCSSTLSPGSTIFVASDSTEVERQVIKYVTEIAEPRGKVVARLNKSEPYHLDRAGSFFNQRKFIPVWNEDASKYYDTFVDLYLLAYGKCLAHGRGGYGPLASSISPFGGGTCKMTFFGREEPCEWQG